MTRARIVIDLLIVAAYGFTIGGAVSQGGAYWYAIVPVALLMIAYNLYCVAVDVGRLTDERDALADELRRQVDRAPSNVVNISEARR